MSFARLWPVLLLLALQFGILHFSAGGLSFTYDEVPHLRYGLRVLAGNTDRFDDSKMPVSALNAFPVRLAGIDEERLRRMQDPAPAIGSAREMTILAALVLAIVVFCWACELYGYAAGIFALVLTLFEPNLTAHSQLVTTDLYAVLTVTLALYTFWRFLRRGGTGRLLASAFALGLAQVAKYSSAYLYPLFIALGLFWLWRQPNRRLLWRPALKAAAVYGLASLVAINAAFLFNRSFMPWRNYDFKSSLLRGLQSRTSVLGAVPVPLPYPYVQGLDLVKYGDETGTGFGNIYLLGETRTGRGFPQYYLVAFLYKTPLGLQALLVWAAIAAWRRRRDGDFLSNELFLAAPALFFAVYFSFLFNAQIGIRYLLVIYPALIVFASGLLKDWPEMGRKARLWCTALTAWIVVSHLSYWGHYLSYFNELVGQRKNSYRILADSNLDWGQNLFYLVDYLRDHPDTIYKPKTVEPGRFIVDANTLTGVNSNPNGRWLNAFEPKEHLVYSLLIFEISAADLARVKPAP